ncbi:MAG: hypothetical protein JRI25_07500 [Deltaproteobacteria bacterium]|nr:hypothetical protein [Deltaproteobacteria bacterium]MBW2254427.1 hypothetical protein [Deltaproteobacteria bacterium]
MRTTEHEQTSWTRRYLAQVTLKREQTHLRKPDAYGPAGGSLPASGSPIAPSLGVLAGRLLALR